MRIRPRGCHACNQVIRMIVRWIAALAILGVAAIALVCGRVIP
jgi:hypothetical protein